MSPSEAGTLSVGAFREGFDGEVIVPGDPDYDRARTVFFRGFDRRPAVVFRALHAADVVRAVRMARETGSELAVRGGGHSVAGFGVSDGGIVLDLSAMRGLEIDVGGRTAWAGAGLTAGEYTSAVGAHGVATGFGDTPSVGVAGITLGGGVGFLHRKLGLAADSLMAADVVTADGELVRADADAHPDLFWAIRGGGGNFGVATRLRFRLHEVDVVVGGMLVLPATPEVVASFIELAATAPDELSGMINVMPAPPMPFVPAEHHGRPILMAVLVHAGGVDAGERAFAPFRALARPVADFVRPMRYPEIYEGEGEPPRPVAMVMRSFFADTVDRPAAGTILDRLAASTAPMRAAQFRVLGGAVARVPAEATAFAHRGRRLMVTVAAAYEHAEEAADHEEWADAFAAELRQGEPGAYVGFLGNQGESRVREAYPAPFWERLRRIKGRYDPTNLFRLNQNVPPDRSSSS